MIRNACLWAVLTATLAFAQRERVTRCDSGRESEHPASSRAMPLCSGMQWRTTASPSWVASRHSRALLTLQSFRSQCMTQ